MTYEKTLSQEGSDAENNAITYTVNVKLLHAKIPCNYSHSVFQISLDGTVVTSENYSKTFGKGNQSIRKLRTKCKLELASMIIKGEVRINW